MKIILAIYSFLIATDALADDVVDENCKAANGITPICGFLAPQDLHALPGGPALIVGGFTLGNGDIRVLHLPDNAIEVIYSTAIASLRLTSEVQQQ